MAQKRIDALNDLFDRAEAQGRFFVAPSEGTRDAIARHSRERCRCERSGRGQGDNGEASRSPANSDSRDAGLSSGRPAAPEAPLPVMNLAPSIYARRGYYEGLNPVARQLHFIHALSAKHPTWVFCGLSAAVLHGLDVCYADVCRGERSLVYVLGKSRCIEYNKCIVQYHQRFSRMNDRQKEAVFHVNGPLLILAGAGSGKTTVLVNRIASLVRWGNAYESPWLYEGCGEEEEAACQAAPSKPGQ